jgi:hypothetical protein
MYSGPDNFQQYHGHHTYHKHQRLSRPVSINMVALTGRESVLPFAQNLANL